MMTMMQYNHKDTSGLIPLIIAHMAGNLTSSPLLTQSIWIIDSGATDHVSITLTQMHDIKHFPSPLHIKLPNGITINVHKYGSVYMNDNHTLFGVLYIPSFHYNLISVSKLMGHTTTTVTFSPFYCFLQDQHKRIAHGTLCNGLYLMQNTKLLTANFSTPSNLSHANIADHTTSSLWQNRLGHPSSHVLKQIKSLPLLNKDTMEHQCSVCPLSKHHALSFPSSTSFSSAKFQLVHIDVGVPYKHSIMNGCKYFLTIVDDYTRTTWTYLLPSKHHAISTLKYFHSFVYNHFNTSIKTIRSDNGLEFLNNSLHDYFQLHGIQHQTTCPYTPPTKWES